ncbi:MAG: response regulator transcription factor [Elusimicrobia bacterium]|nr:response regulator transcription factor [Elusimicrobiota bacterium]
MEAEKTILLVEDDARMRAVLSEGLRGAGYRVIEADGVKVGLHLFRTHEPQLAVLDIDLPDGSGLDVCRGIRASKNLSTTPVIMLTGKGGLEDKGAGFEAGADQYLVKPIAPRELIMWAAALLRRLKLDTGPGEELKAGPLVIELAAHLVRYADQVVSNLTVKEFELLCFLVRKRPQVLSRKNILSNLWHTIAVDNVVDTHIFNLRRKLPREAADRIQSVPGKGFRYFE